MKAVKPSVAVSYIKEVLKARLVPMLHGSPGLGKSAIISQIANEFDLELIDLRLSQCDPTDLSGFPTTNDKGKSYYAPMDTFPIEGDKLPAGKNGWLLFLDEFNSASIAVQKASYKLTLDKMVGQFKLHKNVAIVCAGNLDTDGALVDQMSTANQSRLVHIKLEPSTKDWIEWAQSSDIDYRITSYINFRPSCLQMFDPDHSDMTFACPRTWEFASNLISLWDEIKPDYVNLLSGVLSEGVAREFYQFTKVFKQLPDIRKIIDNPNNAQVPDEPSTLYAMSAVIADNTEKNNVSKLLTYVDRLPKEFQIITIREMSRRCPFVETNELFIKKITEVATHL